MGVKSGTAVVSRTVCSKTGSTKPVCHIGRGVSQQQSGTDQQGLYKTAEQQISLRLS